MRGPISKILLFAFFSISILTPSQVWSGTQNSEGNLEEYLKGSEKTGPKEIERLIGIYEGKDMKRKKALENLYYYQMKAISSFDLMGGKIEFEAPVEKIVFSDFRLREGGKGPVQTSYFYSSIKEMQCTAKAEDAHYYLKYTVEGTKELNGKKVLVGKIKEAIIADTTSGKVCYRKKF